MRYGHESENYGEAFGAWVLHAETAADRDLLDFMVRGADLYRGSELWRIEGKIGEQRPDGSFVAEILPASLVTPEPGDPDYHGKLDAFMNAEPTPVHLYPVFTKTSFSVRVFPIE